jgi:eukaryotic-like serine/threonine-protein kinase
VIDGVAQNVRVLASRYQVGELIGRGGMADVYVGTDARLGRRVAIKLLKPALANDPAFRTRFRREAQDAAKMAHPTIVRIFDAGEEVVREPNGIETIVPFIVMEYVEGRLLKDMIAEGPMEPAEAARIIAQVLTALEYSHRAGVVHRDIKPGNIMVTDSGQVKVMDFGIARAISDSQATIAETSAIVGTAQYFSPEQARGEGVDARTDLYSTGVVLFELLTGRAPFRGDNPVAVAYQHVNSEAVPPSSINPAVSPALDAVVLRSLTKDRFERYQTASEFREDVEAAAAGHVPTRKSPGSDAFNATLFGANPNSTSRSDATLRQLAIDNDRSARTQSRPPVAWIWAGIATMVVIIVAVVFWAFTLTPPTLSDHVSVTVPDVRGMTWEEAEDALDDLGLEPQRVDTINEDIPEEEVIGTNPEAGLDVSPGFEVRVSVSIGAAPIAVPEVSNQPEANAIAALEAVGLVYGTTTSENSPSVAAGVVIRTDPKAGETEYIDADGKVVKIRKGQVINLVTSNGLVNIPDVSGQKAADAANTLRGQLLLTVNLVSDSSCSGGTVSAQSLIGDNPQRSTITLRYCTGG